MKKKFLPAFQPARLVSGNTTCYIVCYADNKSGELIRYRKTFNINRILNKEDRKSRGEDLVRKINFWLSEGLYLEDFHERKCIKMIQEKDTDLYAINIVDAIQMVLDEKISRTERRTSVRSYKSHATAFIDYLQKKRLDQLNLSEFNTYYARQYVHYWIKHLKVDNNNSFNTKLTFIKMFFNWLVKNEYIVKNPFSVIEKRRAKKALKDNFTQEEMLLVWKELKEYNVWMWVASQLAFWGLIRQEELARIKFSNFDYEKWCINLSEDMTKNWKADVITLPLFLRKEFKDIGFFEQPINYYIIGRKVQPSREKIQERKLNDRHKTPLNRLVKKGLFEMRKGISFSSWRRTGMDFYSRKLAPREFKDHNRHESFATTEKYLPHRKIISTVSNLDPIGVDMQPTN